MKQPYILAVIFFSLTVFACDGEKNNGGSVNSSNSDSVDNGSNLSAASVTAVSTSGASGNFTFSVTIESPDTGCEQYADWWEVLTADGNLIYRRILAHSHVNEQPFTRSGGPVAVSADDAVIVRAHMNNAGYGERVFTGSVTEGLTQETLNPSFAEGVAVVDPLPGGCAF